MERIGRGQSTNRVSERGASQQVGVVLLLGLVIISGTLVIAAGMVALDAVQTQASGEHGEQVMRQFDSDLQTAMLDNTTGPVYAPNGEISDSGTITVTVSNGYGDTEQSKKITMGTLHTEDEAGNKFAYQAGGVWRKTGESTSVVSKPSIRYYTEQSGGDEVGRIDLSVTNLRGNVESGTNSVTQQPSTDGLNVSDVGFVSHVAIEVSDTPYHDAWYRFLKTEFEASSANTCDISDGSDKNIICHDEANREVTVIATIDGTNPFANQVGIDPTIYGGLHAEEITDNQPSPNFYGSKLTVRGYSNHNVSNHSTGLFTVDGDLAVSGHAEINGVPVVNTELTSNGKPDISPMAYAAGLRRGTEPPRYKYINTTADGSTAAFWLFDNENHENVVVANMSRPFDSVDTIDTKLNDNALDYLKSNSNVTDIENYGGSTVSTGLYYGDDLDSSIDTIDTSAGDVHIGIGSNTELRNINVTGSNRAYIYTTSDVNIKNNVEVSGERADALWVYGATTSRITIEEDYEGVVYAPGSRLKIEEDVEVTGAVVGGKTTIEDGVTINFDRTIRTDVPIPKENRDISVDVNKTRDPLDVTFVLDRSGSMGRSTTITGSSWQRQPLSPPRGLSMRLGSTANHSIEVRSCYFFGCYNTRTIDPGETFNYVDQARVKGAGSTDSVAIKYGTDPDGLRADATKDFITLMNRSNDDRAGVFEFNSNGYELHSLSRDLDDVHDSVSVTAGGGTDISSGMKRALNEYRTPSTSGRDRIMIVLSDGKNSNPRADRRTRRQAQRAEDLGVTVYTIGLGESNINKPLLRDTATDDGEFHMIDNASQLEDIFEGIADKEIQKESNVTFDINMTPTMTGTSSDYVVNIDTKTVTVNG
ncbi:vWA domain-containing protein [Natrinema sp. 74]|uniref:vWA domain-containing protein n=1 Tax=Natrinema sp. 74 TaxID=3384159 RepID=UPI0038D3D39C